MSAAWIAVHLIDAPARVVYVNSTLILAIGSDPRGGARIVLTTGRVYDVLEDADTLTDKLTQAGS